MKALKIVGKILAVLVVLFAAGLIILGNIGGSDEKYRVMIEEMITDNTPYTAQLATLNNVRFFPTFILDFDGLALAKDVENKPEVTVGSFEIKVGFFDALFGKPRIKAFDLTDFSMKGGIATKERLSISRAYINDPAANAETGSAAEEGAAMPAPQLELTGMLGDKPLRAEIGVAATGSGASRAYDLGDERHFMLSALGLKLDGMMKNVSFSHIQLSNLMLKQGEEMIFSGDMDVKVKGNGRQITGDLKVGQGTEMKPDLLVGAGLAEGRIDVPSLYVEDLSKVASVLAPLGGIAPEKAKTAESGKIDLSGLDVDVTLNLEAVYQGGVKIAEQEIPVTIKKGVLKASQAKGKILSGKSQWNLSLTPDQDSQSGGHVLALTAALDEAELGDMVKSDKQNITVPLDMDIKVSAYSSRWDGLLPALKGRASVVTEDAEFQSRWLNLWGDGIASLILPSLKPSEEAKIACGVFYAPISKGVLDVQSLFLDGAHVQISGSGHYSLADDALNIKLKPQTKGVSIGDLSTAVRMTGKLSAPKVRLDAADAGKKAASLLLGAVNPALMAYAATDIGTGSADKQLCATVEGLSGDNKAVSFADYMAKQAKAAQ